MCEHCDYIQCLISSWSQKLSERKTDLSEILNYHFKHGYFYVFPAIFMAD